MLVIHNFNHQYFEYFLYDTSCETLLFTYLYFYCLYSILRSNYNVYNVNYALLNSFKIFDSF